jgi:hypothetical protein
MATSTREGGLTTLDTESVLTFLLTESTETESGSKESASDGLMNEKGTNQNSKK